ncbi:lipase [Plectosphaerella cucumerina]|uniref:Carboxylic ester hydrolase n=1 Tax=Plectosphaerella cucumerina TaxID=40658 RepID=A0A8K0XAL2_9PEZI|nr:lipase [Plectosphaerella cucumerina]
MKLSKPQTVLAAALWSMACAKPACVYNPVTLEDYGTFFGIVVDQTLSGQPIEPVDAWLGMDFSNQPVGENRFKPIDYPEPFDGIRAASAYGKACPQAITSLLPIDAQAEDCLKFNVYRTQGVPLDRRLPVFLWIHGGAFNRGNQKTFDGASFAANSPEPIVVVSFQYRVGALGFLPSALFEEEGLLNLGIRDQRHFLEFAQKHLVSFGGDPSQVTVGGLSAGAHSVGIHHFGNYGDSEGKELFARVVYQSGSVTSRAFPNASYPLYQTQFAEFVAGLGCEDAVAESNEAALACLREPHVDEIRKASLAVFNKYDPAITWPFQPVHEGPLFEKAGSQSGYDETFFKVPVITTTTSDEGKNYIPGTLETEEDFISFMSNTSPALTKEDLGLISSLYPDPATVPNSPYANAPNSTQYNRLAAAWSDYAYICPGQETAYRTHKAGVPAWKLRWNTNNRNPAWKGIPHATDSTYLWAEPTVEFPEMGRVHHAYIASFALTGDPNTLRLGGSPEWPAYEPSGYGLESEAPLQLVVNSDGAVVEKDDDRREACLFWRDPERAGRLNK